MKKKYKQNTNKWQIQSHTHIKFKQKLKQNNTNFNLTFPEATTDPFTRFHMKNQPIIRATHFYVSLFHNQGVT